MVSCRPRPSAKRCLSRAWCLQKFDNTSKGIVIAIADKQMPIRYVGLGEGIDDLQLFDPRTFVETLLDAGERE
ncbi:MAG: hypothetical protein ACLUEQ_07845 [Cloacibacillus evryensis]